MVVYHVEEHGADRLAVKNICDYQLTTLSFTKQGQKPRFMQQVPVKHVLFQTSQPLKEYCFKMLFSAVWVRW